LGEDEILREGDEVLIDGNWGATQCVGQRVGIREDGYRRRVTPEEKPLGAFLDEQNNELRQQVATLTAEVERLRLTPSEREAMAAGEKALIGYHSLDGVERNAQAAAIRQALLRHGGEE